MELFNRVVIVEIDFGTSTQTIDALDVDFEVKMSRDSKENKATINIFNMNAESRGRIKDPGPIVTLRVGHADTPFTIFKGNITKTAHNHNGVDWVSQMQVGDGNLARKDSVFSRTYNVNSSVTSIIADVAASFTDVSLVNNFVTTAILESSLTLDGKSKEVMEQLSKDYEFDWLINQGTLEITAPRTPPITAPLIPLLTPDTGLTAPPEALDTGVRLKSYIINGLRPNGNLALASTSTRSVLISGGSTTRTSDTSLNGTYLIDKVSMIGSTYDDRFDAVTEGLAPLDEGIAS